MRSLPLVCVVALALAPPARADLVSLVAGRDATLYEDFPRNSNGGGPALFAGTTAGIRGFPQSPRRALLWFDVAGAVPAGAVVTSAVLTLTQERPGNNDDNEARVLTVHRLLADWGEGTVGEGLDAIGSGRGFFTAPDGASATWAYRFYDAAPWEKDGGDFVLPFSALTTSGLGFDVPVVWGPTPALVADVQGWLDAPAGNFGWVVIGEQGLDIGPSVRRFYAREADNPAFRPTLTIEFTPAGPGPAGVPEPAGLALLGLGALGLLAGAGRQRVLVRPAGKPDGRQCSFHIFSPFRA